MSEEKKYLRERFETMESLSQDITNLYSYEYFSCGFRLGVGLMIKALANGNGNSCDNK